MPGQTDGGPGQGGAGTGAAAGDSPDLIFEGDRVRVRPEIWYSVCRDRGLHEPEYVCVGRDRRLYG